jgi:hypothetical protein
VTELSTALPDVAGQTGVWTGTDPAGLASHHCSNWISSGDRDGNQGSLSAVDGGWTAFGGAPVGCNGPGRLYCFQAD